MTNQIEVGQTYSQNNEVRAIATVVAVTDKSVKVTYNFGAKGVVYTRKTSVFLKEHSARKLTPLERLRVKSHNLLIK